MRPTQRFAVIPARFAHIAFCFLYGGDHGVFDVDHFGVDQHRME